MHMAPVDKTMFCFCHWGGENVIGRDGSVTYIGGTTEQFLVESGITYEAFKKIVFDRLGIEPLGKLLHFTVKFNKKQLIRLKDQVGIDHLIQFNDDFAHVYVSNDEAEPIATVVDGMRGSTIEVEPNQIQSEEEHASGDHLVLAPATTSCNDAMLLSSTMWDEVLVGEGQAFENADAFRQAVFKYTIAKKFPYKFGHNRSNYMSVLCAIDGCQWKVTASLETSTNFVSIKKFVDCHSHCLLDQTNFKPKFRAKLMGSIIQKESLDCPTLPREFCSDSLRDFSIPLTYHQAWSLKEKVKKELDGKLENLFKLIPGFCNRLKKAMPGTVATWSCTEDSIFKHLFVAYECSIRGFHAGCRPLIFINVRHLSGPCKGSLIVASSLDADNGMYPLAYGVLTSEVEEDWLWFLQHLKLVVRDREVVIVSDRYPSILAGVGKIFGVDNHAHCYRHVQEIFSKFIDTNHYLKLKSQGKDTAYHFLNEIAYARTMEAYNKALAKMCTLHKELYDWVIDSGPEQWSNALFKKPRWDWLNSNLAESFNAWSEEESLLQIPKMMKAHCKRLSEILLNKKAELGRWKLLFGPKIMEKLFENQKLGHDLVATFQSICEVEVQEQFVGRVVVNVKFGTCTCLEWQMTGIPCLHACRAMELANIDVYQCVAGWYKKEMQELIYAKVLDGVSNIEMPCPNEVGTAVVQRVETGSTSKNNIILGPRPPITKRPPGRPRKNPIESEFLHVRPPRCSRCHGVGHKSKTCKEPSWIWEPHG